MKPPAKGPLLCWYTPGFSTAECGTTSSSYSRRESESYGMTREDSEDQAGLAKSIQTQKTCSLCSSTSTLRASIFLASPTVVESHSTLLLSTPRWSTL